MTAAAEALALSSLESTHSVPFSEIGLDSLRIRQDSPVNFQIYGCQYIAYRSSNGSVWLLHYVQMGAEEEPDDYYASNLGDFRERIVRRQKASSSYDAWGHTDTKNFIATNWTIFCSDVLKDPPGTVPFCCLEVEFDNFNLQRSPGSKPDLVGLRPINRAAIIEVGRGGKGQQVLHSGEYFRAEFGEHREVDLFTVTYNYSRVLGNQVYRLVINKR